MAESSSNIIPKPAKDRYFSNLLAIANRVIVINDRAKRYYDENKSKFQSQNPSWDYPILAPFVLKNGLRTLKEKDPLTCLISFINDGYRHWDKIIDRDMVHFLNLTEELFGDLYGVTEIKALFTERTLTGESFVTKEDEAFIWRLIHAMIRISLNFIREERQENPEIFPDVNLEKYEQFRVALRTPTSTN